MTLADALLFEQQEYLYSIWPIFVLFTIYICSMF